MWGVGFFFQGRGGSLLAVPPGGSEQEQQLALLHGDDGSARWPLVAVSRHVRKWETFHMIEDGQGRVALQSHRGSFVSVSRDGQVACHAPAAARWEWLEKNSFADGTVTLKSWNDLYVEVTESGSVVARSSATVGRLAHFVLHESGGGTCSIESAQGTYLSSVVSSPHRVLHSTDTLGEGDRDAVWIERLGDGEEVAIRSSAGTFFAAQEAGVLVPNSVTIGYKERFTLLHNGDETVSFKAWNGRYASARLSGRITSDAAELHDWEKFHLVNKSQMNIALRKPVLASSMGWGGAAFRTTDGKDNHGIYVEGPAGVCTHTKNETPSWVSVDLMAQETVQRLRLVGRTGFPGAGAFSRNLTIRVGSSRDGTDQLCQKNVDASGGMAIEVSCKKPYPKGRYATVWSDTWIVICELQAFVEEDGGVFLQTSHGTSVAGVEVHPGDQGVPVRDFRNAGFSPEELKLAGYSLATLKDAGFTYVEMRRATGITFVDLQMAGFLPDDYSSYTWVSTTPAPKESDPGKVACEKGRPFAWPWIIPKDVPQFQGLPPSDDWERIWHRILHTSQDPCETPVLAKMVLGEAKRGFGSDMNNFGNEALVAMYTGLPLSLCAPDDVRNLWSESFVNPGLPSCRNCTVSLAKWDLTYGAWAAGAQTSIQLASKGTFDALTLVGLKRFIYNKLFVLKPHLEQGVSHLIAQLGLGVPFVAVHIRRGDKRIEAGFFRKTSDFVTEAVRLCEAVGARKVFLASDDAGEFSKFQSLLRTSGPSIDVVEQPRLPPETYAQRGTLGRQVENTLIFDLMLMIRADAYVGTASSNLDRYVYFMRDPRTQSISLDDGGDYLWRNC